MDAQECLTKVEDYVQECRENGETDLRSILYFISSVRSELEEN